ncbi:cyclophilin-like fold protein [Nocardioides caldifontis]|uniref:cyclophilin-like fold protein n=1 Tax=Nocardioides caldifontis TaxID=2588938 RepID=UPI001939FA20|nr:cyclophilin-like fold protein [Nocardioides caldifontis]
MPTVILTALLGAGCGNAVETSDDQVAADPESTTHSTPPPTPSRSPAGNAAGEPAESQENRMNIQITIGDQTFTAELQDSPTTHDLLAQLPLTVEMVDHGGVEKTGPLPGPLSLEGQPEGADPDGGHVGYYAPGNDLVLYYGDQSYFPGIVTLGRMDGDAAERIADMDGSLTATIEAR